MPFSQDLLLNFVDTLDEVRGLYYTHLKVTDLIFSGKFLFWGKCPIMGKNDPKIVFLQVCQKFCHYLNGKITLLLIFQPKSYISKNSEIFGTAQSHLSTNQIAGLRRQNILKSI